MYYIYFLKISIDNINFLAMRYEIQGSRVVSFTDGGNSHEGVIIDEHANGYALYV